MLLAASTAHAALAPTLAQSKSSPTQIILIAFVGALALWVFVVHCLTVPAPFLNPRLLLDRNFSIGVMLAFVMGMLNFTSIVLYPTLLHDLRGRHAHSEHRSAYWNDLDHAAVRHHQDGTRPAQSCVRPGACDDRTGW